MPRIRVAAINHFDVFARDKLIEWFRALRNSESSDPGFVAVEYDEDHFRRIAAQRPQMHALVEDQWPGTPNEIVRVIELSLGYEGDAHLSVFGSTEVLWLDRGRNADPDDIDKFAIFRMAKYSGFLRGHCRALGFTELEHLSCEALALAQANPPTEGGDSRDPIFAETIVRCIEGSAFEWAIAVVGSNHAEDVRGTMTNRLQAAGIKCQVERFM